jgi:predicted flap endonuclease-1-like 5' DNA nuclease
MIELLQDPVFYWLMWAIFTMVGTIIGWWLRANTLEKDVRHALARIEQEKNTLARLYTHVKHQHDLREADFRRASLELSNLHAQVQWLENERVSLMPDAQVANARIERAEANAAQYAQKVAAIEMLAQNLRAKNTQLTADLERARQELTAWETIYRDFKMMQERLMAFEQSSKGLAIERDALRESLAAARTEIESLQREILKVTALSEKQGSGRTTKKGGPAAPEHTDDLKLIKGVTPPLEQKLKSLGIHTFIQISRWDDEAVIAFSRALGVSPGKVFQEDWVGQARYLAGEKA